MSTEITTSFTRYKLTETEQLIAQDLNYLQKQHIQNLLADVAEEKIALTYDPLNPVKFAQQEADLTGKLTILRYILELSELEASATTAAETDLD